MRVMRALLLDVVVLGAHPHGKAQTRPRPLRPYPQRAVYSRTGSTDQAENFVCR